MRIIGLAGAAGSGKSMVAEMLAIRAKIDGMKYSATVALADPLKRFCAAVFGFTAAQLWGPSERRNESPPGLPGPTARRALQMLGTEWGRTLDEDVWVRNALAVADRLEEARRGKYTGPAGFHEAGIAHPCGLVIIPDVRFHNEADAIRARKGGEVWLLRRDVEPAADHESEAHFEALRRDREVPNHGTVDDLFVAVRAAWEASG